MAGKNDIDSFEVTSWGNVKIITRGDRGEVTHEYYSVPKVVLKKFLNASKAPTVRDFEDWLNEEHNKRDSKEGVCYENNFWSND